MPRPATLDQIKQHEICALLACGASRRQAADYVGCATTTIANTARRDPEFADRLIAAECNYALRNLRAINRAASRSWRAAVWALREHDPEAYGYNRVSHAPPASIARAAARETAVGVPPSADPPAPHAGQAQIAHSDRASQCGPSLRDDDPIGPRVRIHPQVPVVGHNPPSDVTVVGRKPPFSPPIKAPFHVASSSVACRRTTWTARHKTAVFWAAAVIACFLLGYFQPVLQIPRDGDPFRQGAGDLDTPLQPRSADDQRPIVGHQPPSTSAVQQPIVGRQPPPFAADHGLDPPTSASPGVSFTVARPATVRLP